MTRDSAIPAATASFDKVVRSGPLRLAEEVDNGLQRHCFRVAQRRNTQIRDTRTRLKQTWSYPVARAMFSAKSTLVDAELMTLIPHDDHAGCAIRRALECVELAFVTSPPAFVRARHRSSARTCEQAWNFGSGANLVLIGSRFHPG